MCDGGGADADGEAEGANALDVAAGCERDRGHRRLHIEQLWVPLAQLQGVTGKSKY